MENTRKIGISVEKGSDSIDRRLSVAPMMDWTDRHCRYFLRGFSAHALLYTEMITAAGILRGDRARLLKFDPAEQPVALQLGGSEPEDLANAAAFGAAAGYREINLNCGCPSEKVQRGSFGACLMSEPQLVARCVAAMRAAVRDTVPVTVKMRIGTVAGRRAEAADDAAQFSERDWESLCEFVRAVQAAGCAVAIVHARKAVLGGWSPKDNREVPPLRFDVVGRLREEFRPLPVVVNGGIRSCAQAIAALAWSDGVMLGREAYHNPMVLAEIAMALGASPQLPQRRDLLARMAEYAQRECAVGERLGSITRHMLGLLAGQPHAREYRRLLSEGARETGAGPQLIREVAALA